LHGCNTDATIPKIPKFDQFWNFWNAGRRQRSSSYPKARALGCTVWGAPARPGFPNHSPAPGGCFPASPRKGGPTGSQAKNQKLPKTGALSNHFQNSQHPSRNSCNGTTFSLHTCNVDESRCRESLTFETHIARPSFRKFRNSLKFGIFGIVASLIRPCKFVDFAISENRGVCPANPTSHGIWKTHYFLN
jgi:hypothetical protein